MLYFEDVCNLTTLIELDELYKNPNIIYHHFMNYGDEVFYILDNGKMYGTVTPGDLYRSKGCAGEYVNTKFQYITSKNDFEGAYKIFGKYPTIHEVAIITDGGLIGVIKSGKRKTPDEWRKIRASLQDRNRDDNTELLLKEINKLMEINGRFFAYPYLVDTKKEMMISENAHKSFLEKASYYSGAVDISCLPLKEQRDFFGEYTWKYHQTLARMWNSLKLRFKNGIPQYIPETGNELYTINEHGYRIVPGAKELNAKKKIFTVGPCTMLGEYTANEETIQAYLQEKLIENGFHDYEVVNLSVATELSIARLFSAEIAEDDIIIIMTKGYPLWKEIESMYPDKVKCIDDLGSIWKKIDNPLSCLYDSYNHCNWKVNREIAYKMYEDIRDDLSKESTGGRRVRLQDYYISPDIYVYYRRHFIKYAGVHQQGKIGAIVMNCNPFTKGHRYLIEKAARQVDCLYVFVVEEDKSVFSFEDRLHMVQAGTKDIENVLVIPSGEYIISQNTFEQYFNKDQVETVEDMDYDVRIFGEVVAKEFDITVRFVGEEPFDKVTCKYNETMKKILPDYGIDVMEIPRVSNAEGEIISASKVRKYLQEGNREALHSMLPSTTLDYLLGES